MDEVMSRPLTKTSKSDVLSRKILSVVPGGGGSTLDFKGIGLWFIIKRQFTKVSPKVNTACKTKYAEYVYTATRHKCVSTHA